MMVIMKNALRERIRRKELYIVAAIALLLLLLLGSGAATLSIDGKAVTGFSSMFGVLLSTVNVVSCILAVVLSLKTIPNEYEQKTSHLIWIRGISQCQYHAQLALANLCSSVFSAGILYLGIVVYTVMHKEFSCLWRLIPAFFVLCVSVAVVSSFVSVLSIVLPSFLVGILGAVCAVTGCFHTLLELLQNILGGFSGTLLKGLLIITPDLASIEKQAENIVFSRSVQLHVILSGLLAIYIISLGIFVFKRKEA